MANATNSDIGGGPDTLTAHDLMRERVAEGTADLIASEGMEALTIRAVARRMNSSIAVVQHYFVNKRELVDYVHAFTAARSTRCVKDALRADPDDALGALVALLPLDASRIRDWRVFIAFLGTAVGNREAMNTQTEAFLVPQRLAVKQLSALNRAGKVSYRMPPEFIAQTLVQAVVGTAHAAIFDEANWPPERQIDAISQLYRTFVTEL